LGLGPLSSLQCNVHVSDRLQQGVVVAAPGWDYCWWWDSNVSGCWTGACHCVSPYRMRENKRKQTALDLDQKIAIIN